MPNPQEEEEAQTASRPKTSKPQWRTEKRRVVKAADSDHVDRTNLSETL